MRYFFWCTILLSGGFACFAQNQTTVVDSIQLFELQPVTVLAKKDAVQKFHQIQSFKNPAKETVRQLDESSHIYVNQQGLGLLSTVVIRGQSTQSIPVVWKNWTLNSAMNGLFDLSLINSFLLNTAQVVYAETQQSPGWGGAGASLQFENTTDFSSRQLMYQYGSFGKQQIGVSYGFEKKITSTLFDQISNQTKIVYHKANNDFLINLSGNDAKKQINNAFKEWGFINSTQLKLANQHTIEADIWWQKTNREIPTIFGLPDIQNQSHQLDSALRVSINWLPSNKAWEMGIAYFNELNQYTDPFKDINGIHKIQSFKSYAQYSKAINPALNSFTSLHYQVSKANSTNLEKAHHLRNTLRLKTHLIYQFKTIPLSFKTDATIELTDGKVTPFRPGFYVYYNPQKNVHLKAQLSRHYQLPTFNDLYWQLGGNLNLKPQKGWLAELNASYQIKNWTNQISFYKNIVNEEIIWLPDGNVWKPQNIAKVNNIGFDVNTKNQFMLNHKTSLQIKAAYTFAHSVKVKSKLNNDNSLNKQLIYKPRHKMSASALFKYENYTAEWAYRFVGKRFTTADHSNFVEGYHISDFTFSYLVPIDALEFQLNATVYNLWNASYEIISKRPMPGRHFLLTANFKF